MSLFVSQILLPVVLAAIMLAMGLGLSVKDFQRIILQPRAVLLGLLLQIAFLPLLALAIITLVPLSPMAAAGLFLVSLCPGGATSNLFSFLARGDIALSVTLTGLTSLLSPIILPLAFYSYLAVTADSATTFAVPLITLMKQLALVTLVPVSTGMIIRRMAPSWSNSVQPIVRRIATGAMIAIVFALMATNLNVVQALFSLNSLAVLLLATGSLIIAFGIAARANLNQQQRRTIAIEVGVQNAGTAMMVALAILHTPELAFVPLMYGLFMNLPAFGFLAWLAKRDARQLVASR
ncbi:bile acid:sodium symporter family protein [Reinekea thalattae]|uniref:Bile acid:sodium symporter family protein n=1 Tax=Reinekea thalattae TaxID=2593301 RepID=A0A5C8Z5W3_9GAMM|nr:bile acid:sodium symporter family protein [Reinekea thalattae]TXR53007.1 bile acid:sodium symporter family protein [Reinekea thalattae]